MGNGQQCYRDWEALYAGAVPLLDDRPPCQKELYRGLPVIFIGDWTKVTAKYLLGKWKTIQANAARGDYDLRRLHWPYWLRRMAVPKEGYEDEEEG